MSRLTDLIREAKQRDPALGVDLERELRVLSERLPFGLNFERHRPEAVELPGRPARRGDKVCVMVKRILNRHGYPSHLQEKATDTVLEQAEVLTAEWVPA